MVEATGVITIVNTLGPKLYRFFLASRSNAVAEELVQEVFVRLMSSHHTSNLGTLEAFAWGIAQNLNREARRKSARGEVLIEDYPGTPEPSLIVSDIENNEQALRKGIDLLDEPQKTIMQLILADLKISEIASQINMPEGTVKSHVHRAKENLKLTFRKWGIL